MQFDNSFFIEDSRFDAEKYDHFFQFKECKSIDEYINENPLTDLSNIVYEIYK